MKQRIGRLVRHIARIFAQETYKVEQAAFEAQSTALAAKIVDEWERRQAERDDQDQRVRVDLPDLLAQGTKPEANRHLQQFFSMNHRWVANLAERNRRTAVSTFDFIDAEMPDAVFGLDQFDIIRTRPELMDQVGGNILDLGVYKGSSTRALAKIYPDKIIHGFDSFEGLPEDWEYTLKGSFGEMKGKLPDVPDNVRLYKGWFEDTLPGWAEAHGDDPISILRVDCDLYSSTKTIFDELGHLLVPGTFVVFDEMIGYRGWQNHEHKAFSEFLATAPFTARYHAYGLTYVIAELVAAD